MGTKVNTPGNFKPMTFRCFPRLRRESKPWAEELFRSPQRQVQTKKAPNWANAITSNIDSDMSNIDGVLQTTALEFKSRFPKQCQNHHRSAFFRNALSRANSEAFAHVKVNNRQLHNFSQRSLSTTSQMAASALTARVAKWKKQTPTATTSTIKQKSQTSTTQQSRYRTPPFTAKTRKERKGRCQTS